MWDTVWMSILFCFFSQPCLNKFRQNRAVSEQGVASYCSVLLWSLSRFLWAKILNINNLNLSFCKTLNQPSYLVLKLIEVLHWDSTLLFKYAWCRVELHNQQASTVSASNRLDPWFAPLLRVLMQFFFFFTNCGIHTFTRKRGHEWMHTHHSTRHNLKTFPGAVTMATEAVWRSKPF